MDKLTLEIITPAGVFFQGPAYMAILQSTEGELGVMPGHIPLTAMIDSTVLYYKEEPESEQKKCTVHRGFMRILPDRLTVCVAAAEWPEQIDEARALAAKQRAEEHLQQSRENNEVDVLRAEAALKRAISRLTLLK